MKKNILVIKSSSTEFDEGLMENLNKYGNDELVYTLAHYDDFIIEFIDGNINITVHDISLDHYDFVFFKSWVKDKTVAITIGKYLEYRGIKFVDSAVTLSTNGDKITQYGILTLGGFKIPNTLYIPNKKIIKRIERVEDTFSYPFIFKAASAREGNDNYLIHNREELLALLPTIDAKKNFMFQEFIPNSFDYRVVVMGTNVVAIKMRVRKDDSTHKNNVSLGASVEYIEPKTLPKICDIAIKSSQAFSREITGVDVIVSDLNGENYILEVNPSPAFRNDFTILEHLNNYFKSTF